MEAIGINLYGLIAQIVNFVLLLIVLRLVLYKPVLRMLDERSNRIKESMDRAEQIKREAARTQEEFQAQLAEARRQGQEVVAQATQVGERLKEEARQDAQRQAEGIITRARAEIRMERDRAIAELRSQFADLTVLAVGKVINRSLDKRAHEQLISDVLAESSSLKTNGGSER